MILVTMESSPLAITENTESTMFEKENPLISLSIVKLTLFGSLYTIRSSTVNLKQNPRFFSFLFFFLLQNLLDRDFILITGNPIIFKFQRERKNYDSRSIDHREIWYERSNVTVEFKITKKKKKERSIIEIRNSIKNNIPPTLLHDSPYRRANRSYSRTSNCTPPRAKIRNWRAVAEPWQWWSPINRTQGGKSTSSRQPWSAWIRPGCTIVTASSRWLIPWCKPVFPTPLPVREKRQFHWTCPTGLTYGISVRGIQYLVGTFIAWWWWWIEQGPEVSGISKFYSDPLCKNYLRGWINDL